MATGGMSAAGGGGLTGPGSSATVKTKDGDSWSTTAARAGPDHGTSSSTERPLLWSEEAAAGHKARSSAGSGPTGHSWVGCDGEEHTKQTPSILANTVKHLESTGFVEWAKARREATHLATTLVAVSHEVWGPNGEVDRRRELRAAK